MLENSFYTNNNVDKQVFNAAGNTWQVWSKPEGRTMAYIVCIGGGGAGGAGVTNATTNVIRSGGGGGGSSAITIAQVPFYSIPDTLYIQVALGGIGGTATAGDGNAGGNGGLSYVSCYPTTDMFNCLVVNGSVAALGGTGGKTNSGPSAGGTAGFALTSSSTTNPRYLSLCNWVSYTGVNGASGGVPSPGSTSICSNGILNSGPGGGGINASNSPQVGGLANSADLLTSFFKTLTGGTIGGGSGRDGYSQLKPFIFLSGSGGGSSTGGPNGGNGGFSQIGCGGGGGGASTTLAGNGGNGGNGLVMIISY